MWWPPLSALCWIRTVWRSLRRCLGRVRVATSSLLTSSRRLRTSAGADRLLPALRCAHALVPDSRRGCFPPAPRAAPRLVCCWAFVNALAPTPRRRACLLRPRTMATARCLSARIQVTSAPRPRWVRLLAGRADLDLAWSKRRTLFNDVVVYLVLNFRLLAKPVHACASLTVHVHPRVCWPQGVPLAVHRELVRLINSYVQRHPKVPLCGVQCSVGRRPLLCSTSAR